MPRLADFVKDVSQGVLVLRLESNIEIDRSVVGRKTLADPVVRDDVPLVFYNHILSRRWDSERERGATKERG